MSSGLAAVVMAGGLGTRMRSATPKHLHPLLGRRMVDWVIATAADAGADEIVFQAAKLWPALDRLEPHNVQGELYLTDAIGFLVADGDTVAVHVAPDPVEAEGINTRVELAAAAAALRDRINAAHMLAGVTIVDPQATW